ncbi:MULTISPECIES: hypothetical protein [Aerosakkonema]|uniref:hypothetical protein n=1 Tax=Aerosakkonema TaxID=1246629 RepID=UPI0035BB2298
MYYSLERAIELYRKSKLNGKEIFAFPPKLNPSDFCAELTAHSCSCGDNNKAYTPLEAQEIDQLTPTENSTD